jgi:hypothetical protein
MAEVISGTDELALAPMVRRTQVTVESLVVESEQVRVKAMESGQFNAANTAIKGKAVLTGQWVERAEIGSPGEFDHLADDQVLQALDQRFRSNAARCRK